MGTNKKTKPTERIKLMNKALGYLLQTLEEVTYHGLFSPMITTKELQGLRKGTKLMVKVCHCLDEAFDKFEQDDCIDRK